MAYPGDVYSSKCSARDALALISGKWVMLILPALAQRPMRNGERCAASTAFHRRC